MKKTTYMGWRLSKITKLVTNWNGICDCLLVVNSNLGHILHGFGAMVTYWSKIASGTYQLMTCDHMWICWWTLYRQ